MMLDGGISDDAAYAVAKINWLPGYGRLGMDKNNIAVTSSLELSSNPRLLKPKTAIMNCHGIGNNNSTIVLSAS